VEHLKSWPKIYPAWISGTRYEKCKQGGSPKLRSGLCGDRRWRFRIEGLRRKDLYRMIYLARKNDVHIRVDSLKRTPKDREAQHKEARARSNK